MKNNIREDLFGVSDFRGFGSHLQEETPEMVGEGKYHQAEAMEPSTAELSDTKITPEMLCKHF